MARGWKVGGEKIKKPHNEVLNKSYVYYLFFTFVNSFLNCSSVIFPVMNREINVVWDKMITPFYLILPYTILL